tara:strand:- start:123 stop:311 length:189 start_codon:yes stop_codon:yes gene_type:complete
MKQKMKNAINVLEDLEFDKEFRILIDNEYKFQKFDATMVLLIETLKSIMEHKYGIGSHIEDK